MLCGRTMRTLTATGRWLPLLVAVVACASHQDASTHSTVPESEAATIAPGAITGFGLDGQPRQWGSDGRAVKPALDMLVNDLGADFFRVEVNNGETDWETTNDDADPKTFNWTVYDKVFSGPVFQDLWDYVRYLNQLGVPEIELADHGGLPAWMGPSGSSDPASSLDSSKEDEWVETSVAMLVYALTRSPLPHPQFTLFSPFNEPEFSPPEGFKIDPGTQGARIIRKLVDRMNAIPDLNGIRIVVSDSASEAGMITFRQAIQNDTVVQARLAATSFHRYSDASVWSTWNNSNPPVWLTEFNSTWQASCYTTTWTMGMQAVGNLVSALQNGITAGLAWSDYDAPHIHQDNEWQSFGLLATTYQGKSNLCGAFNNTQPADSVLDAMTYTPKPTYLALRHGFKWIRRGATRVTASDNSSSVDLVAYRNPDGSIAVFGRNTGGAANVQVTLTTSSPPTSLTPRYTTATTTDQVGTTVSLANGVGTFALPAQSVFTLLSAATGGGTGGGSSTGGTGGTGGSSATGGTGAGTSTGGSAATGGSTAAGGTSGRATGGSGGTSGRTTGGSGGTSSTGGSAGRAGSAGRGGSAGTSSTGGTSSMMSTGGASGTAGSTSGSAGASGSGSLPALVAGWAFNEGSGATTADASGHGHTGTINGATWVATGCKFGACLSFAGSSGKNVTTPDAADLDLGVNFTIAAWVKPTTVSGWRPVLIKENSGGTEAYLFYSNPSSQGAYFTDSASHEWSVAPSGNVSTSAWSHVVMVRSGTSLSYWVNGVSVGSASVSSLPVTTSSGILAIGGHTFWNGEWYSGLMDDVRIYASALSSAQIQQAMSSGL